MWIVTLYPAWLDAMSDEAVAWVIAHELGHVASGMACGSLAFGTLAHTRVSGTDHEYQPITPEHVAGGEKIADAIARAWGFWIEEELFKREPVK